MTRKTNLLVVSLIAMMTVGAAHATSVTKEYVDSQDNQFYQRIRTQDSRIATIRDWVNPQDEDGNRAELTTEAQDAYRAINELDAAVKAIEIPEQVNADWNAESGAAQILNKPDMTQYATTAAVEQAIEDIEIPEQVNADWNAESGAAQILNKPDLSTYATTAAVQEAIEAIEVPEQVNADWNAESGAAQILNKPDLSTYATTAAMNEALADKADASDLDDLAEDVVALDNQINGDPENENDHGLAGAVTTNADAISLLTTMVGTKQDTISDLSTIRDNATAGAGAAAALGEGFDSEHTVAAALDAKADLNDIPEQVQANWNEADSTSPAYIANKPDLSTYATTAAVEQAIEAIDIPEQVQANWAQTDSEEVDFIKNKPEVYTKTEVDQAITNAALDGNVTVDSTLSLTSENPVQNKVVTGSLPNFDSDTNAVVTVPVSHGAYVLGYVNGKPAYIAVVDGDGNTGVDVPWGD